MELRQVYVSGALTNSNSKPFYEKIGHLLSELGYDPYIPHYHTDPIVHKTITPKEIYEKDMLTIDASASLIAWLGSPSLGVGAELERANTNCIPIVILYPSGTHVSEFVLGIPNICKVIEYNDEDSALSDLRSIFDSTICSIRSLFLPFYNVDASKYKDVYQREMHEFQDLREFTALVKEPSFEVGMKLERANFWNIPTTLIYPKGTVVSRLALGCPCVSDQIIY